MSRAPDPHVRPATAMNSRTTCIRKVTAIVRAEFAKPVTADYHRRVRNELMEIIIKAKFKAMSLQEEVPYNTVVYHAVVAKSIGATEFVSCRQVCRVVYALALHACIRERSWDRLQHGLLLPMIAKVLGNVIDREWIDGWKADGGMP